MTERTYRILNKILRLSVEDPYIIPEGFDKFLCTETERADIVIADDGRDDGRYCYGIGYLSDRGRKISNVFFSRKDSRQMLYSHGEDYARMHLHLEPQCTQEILAELLMVGFYSYVSLRETLLLHASAIYHKGKVVVFTAASGVGKTTQSELWQKHRNAAIINGDKVFLAKECGKTIAWGSPWKGSSDYAENIGAETAAIIVLEQGEENTIRKLSGMEILEKLLPHVFFPNWDARCEHGVLDLLNELLEQTEVYFLRCRPDEDAVAMVEKTVF